MIQQDNALSAAMTEKNHRKRALPDESPLVMNRHEVSEAGHRLNSSQQTMWFRLRTFVAQLFVFMVTAGLSTYGIREMYLVLNTNNITNLQIVFLVLFSINFLWVAFAFSQALLGFLLHLKPRLVKESEIDPSFKTAILLPIYNEDPLRIRATIEAMSADLIATAPGKYAFFILSDTNRANAWIAEEATFLALINK